MTAPTMINARSAAAPAATPPMTAGVQNGAAAEGEFDGETRPSAETAATITETPEVAACRRRRRLAAVNCATDAAASCAVIEEYAAVRSVGDAGVTPPTRATKKLYMSVAPPLTVPAGSTAIATALVDEPASRVASSRTGGAARAKVITTCAPTPAAPAVGALCSVAPASTASSRRRRAPPQSKPRNTTGGVKAPAPVTDTSVALPTTAGVAAEAQARNAPTIA